MSKHLCLRCKTVVLSKLLPHDPDISFFECLECGRQYSLKPGKTMVFRWGHPISLVLYGIIFDDNPVEWAETTARSFVVERTPPIPLEGLQRLVDEIRLELKDPTHQVREILNCIASEEKLREFLHLFANHVERLMTERNG